MSDVVAESDDGMLFHACGAATGNAWSPKVVHRIMTDRTTSVVVAIK